MGTTALTEAVFISCSRSTRRRCTATASAERRAFERRARAPLPRARLTALPRDADRARLDRVARRRERGTQKEYQIRPRARGRARRAAQTARADAERRQAGQANGTERRITMEKDTKRVWHLPYCFWNQGNWSANLHVWRRRDGCWKNVPAAHTYRRGAPNEYEYRVQYIYESRDGQRADYVKNARGHGRREGRRYGFIPCTAQESGRCAVYALF